MELRRLGLENQLWEASRKEIQEVIANQTAHGDGNIS